MKRFFTFSILFFAGIILHGNIVHQQLYLNRGIFTTVNNTTFPFLAFNDSANFKVLNKVVNVFVNDTLVFNVHNNDTIPHAFAVRGINSIGGVMLPGDSLSDSLTATTEKVFVYYDSLNYPVFRYLGAAGMICFCDPAVSKKFYWNVKEHEMSYNQQLATGGNVNWLAYEPDYFTLNSLSHPDAMMDTLSHVVANVGDTIHLYIVNTGNSIHSLHFHGFHSRVIYSSSSRIKAGWIKDTYPMESMEGIVIEIIPDKPGQYSVHDHNLVAVTGGHTAPNGMITIMDIY
jgi:hypothetical protein